MLTIKAKNEKNFRSKKGVALAMAILLLLIVSISVVAIMAVSLTENKTEIYQNNRTQAYSLAWSGANSVGDYIIKHPLSAFSLDSKKSINTNGFSNGAVEVEVAIDPATSHLLIKAEGTVNGVSNTAGLRLQQLSSNLMLDRAIYSNAPLDITGMLVSGDVQSGGNINYSSNGSNTFTGVSYPNDVRIYELAAFPNPTLYNGTGIIDLKKTDLTINGSGYRFTDINIENQANLTLQPNGIMKIVVDDMTIDSNLLIDSSSGRVEIYINHELTVTTKGEINNTIPSNMIIFLKAGSTFYMQANKVLNGYVIGPDATMEIQSAQSTTNGALITNVIRKNSQGQGPNGAVNYVPPTSDLDIDDILISYRVLMWE